MNLMKNIKILITCCNSASIKLPTYRYKMDTIVFDLEFIGDFDKEVVVWEIGCK